VHEKIWGIIFKMLKEFIWRISNSKQWENISWVR
jgi:hypothetical protein